jgi:hypothetical protein
MSLERPVKIKDRDTRTNEIRSMLHLLGFRLDYEETDLLVRGLALYDEKGGEVNLKDGIRLHTEWEKRWDDYHKEDKKDKP